MMYDGHTICIDQMISMIATIGQCTAFKNEQTRRLTNIKN